MIGLDAWKARYYRIDASKVQEEDVIKHSLRKWLGLRKKILERYSLTKIGRKIGEYNPNGLGFLKGLSIDAGSCALCQYHLLDQPVACATCPLKISLGRKCDISYGWDIISEYQHWVSGDDPIPMITALVKIWKAERNCKLV